MIPVRVDQDIIETLKDMAEEGGSYQQLLYEALTQWCQAQTTGQGPLVDVERRLEAVNQRLEDALEAQHAKDHQGVYRRHDAAHSDGHLW